MSDVHLGLQGLEIIREIGLDLAAHALARPLFKTADLLVDVHGLWWSLVELCLDRLKLNDSSWTRGAPGERDRWCQSRDDAADMNRQQE